MCSWRWLVVAAALAPAARADAQPHVRFEVRGSCPSEEEVVRAFGSQVLVTTAEASAWSVAIDGSGQESATLVLRTPAGEVSSERTIQSRDCRALAEAFALIVLAHFAELRLLRASASKPEAAQTSARTTVTTAQPTPAPIATGDRRLELGVGIGAGLGLGVAPASAAPAAEVALAIGPRESGWLARFGAHASAPVRQRSAADRVEHWTAGARLEFGGRLRLGPSAWLALTAGGGAAFAHVTALDLAGRPGTLRLWPAATASAALGLVLGRGWSLLFGSAGRVYLRTDRYRISPDGVVAKSPKGDVSATVGVQFDRLL